MHIPSVKELHSETDVRQGKTYLQIWAHIVQKGRCDNYMVLPADTEDTRGPPLFYSAGSDQNTERSVNEDANSKLTV